MNPKEPKISEMTDSWKQLLSFLPEQWEEKCMELGAIKRELRKYSGPEAILHTFFIHLLGGYPLRQTTAVAKVGNIADVSHVAVFNRLKVAGEWLRWMAEQMIDTKAVYFTTSALNRLEMNIRLVDGTLVSEPGSKGSDWRIHYAFDLKQMRCTEVKVTDYTVGESFKNFTIEKNTLYIADRYFFHPQNIAYVVNKGADVLVRMSMKKISLYHLDGKRFGLLRHLRSLQDEEVGDWPVFIKQGNMRIEGRICALRKCEMAADHARKELVHEYRRKHKNLTRTVLDSTKYLFVFTTLSVEQLPAAAALELYRGRWQVEIAFKRMKSILGLGQMHKKNPEEVIAWLHGKLLCALLIEKLLMAADHFSHKANGHLHKWHKGRSLWRETSFMLTALLTWVMPLLSIHMVFAMWQTIATTLDETPRKRVYQYESLLQT